MKDTNIKADAKEKVAELQGEIDALEQEIEESRNDNTGEDEVLIQDLEEKREMLDTQMQEVKLGLNSLNVTTDMPVYEIEINKQIKKYTVVPASLSDPATGLISSDTPLGVALSGKMKGDSFAVDTPGGVIKGKIIKVG